MEFMGRIRLLTFLILFAPFMVYTQDDEYVHISNEIDEDDSEDSGELVPPEKEPPIEEVEISPEDAECLKKKMDCADDNDNIISKRSSRIGCNDTGFKPPSYLTGSERFFRITPNKPGIPDLKVCRALVKNEKFGHYFIMGQAWLELGEWKCGFPYGGVMNIVKSTGYFEILTGTGYYLDPLGVGTIPSNALRAGVQADNLRIVVNWPGLLAYKHTRHKGGHTEYFVGRIPYEDDAFYIYYMSNGGEYYKRRPFWVVACR